MRKSIFLLVGIFLFFSLLTFSSGNAPIEPYIITERTEYGVVENTMYVTIKENLGLNHYINVNQLLPKNEFTERINYKTFLVNHSYIKKVENVVKNCPKDVGKVDKENKTINISCSYNITFKEFNASKYSNTNNLIYERRVNFDSVENIKKGLYLPKNSEIQLKIIYSHPPSFNINPSAEENKFDIEVCSTDKTYCSILDPTWWNVSWDKKAEIKIQENSGSSTNNYTMDLRIPYDSDMNEDYSDLRFLNGSETTEYGYWIYFSNSSEARVKVLLDDNLSANNNISIYMYYGNPSAPFVSDIADAHLLGEDGADFSEWEELDSGDDIELNTTSQRVEFEMYRDGSTGVIRQQITPINDYIIEFMTNVSSADGGSVGYVGGSNYSIPDYYPTQANGVYAGIDIGNFRWRTIETGPTYNTADNSSVNFNTTYYIRLNRTSDVVNYYAYSDATKETIVASGTSGSSVSAIRYAYMLLGVKDNADPGVSTVGWVANYSVSTNLPSSPTYFIQSEETGDVVAPNVTINSPSASVSSASIKINFTAIDDVGLSACFYNISRGASTEKANTYLSTTNLTDYYTLTGEASYILHVSCNDTSRNINYTTLSFTYTINASPVDGGGGGGGGSSFSTVVALIKPNESMILASKLQRAILYSRINEFCTNFSISSSNCVLNEVNFDDLIRTLKIQTIDLDEQELDLWLGKYNKGELENVQILDSEVESYNLDKVTLIITEPEFQISPFRIDSFWIITDEDYETTVRSGEILSEVTVVEGELGLNAEILTPSTVKISFQLQEFPPDFVARNIKGVISYTSQDGENVFQEVQIRAINIRSPMIIIGALFSILAFGVMVFKRKEVTKIYKKIK